MIADWIYDHPTGLWGSILVCGTTALACLGLALFHPFVDVGVRRAHNDLAGFSIAIISVVYAVLLAFIAVATWESFSSAETIVQAEAGYIGNLYRDTKGFPDQIGEQTSTLGRGGACGITEDAGRANCAYAMRSQLRHQFRYFSDVAGPS